MFHMKYFKDNGVDWFAEKQGGVLLKFVRSLHGRWSMVLWFGDLVQLRTGCILYAGVCMQLSE